MPRGVFCGVVWVFGFLLGQVWGIGVMVMFSFSQDVPVRHPRNSELGHMDNLIFWDSTRASSFFSRSDIGY